MIANRGRQSQDAAVWLVVPREGGEKVFRDQRIRWIKRPSATPTLADLNRRLAADHERVMQRARRNTARLTGREVL
ncbi:MAG: hypothetical protein JNM80_01390 [Phycisphaerae bacterium]|nr:hypothetical protein [Phycisphaerae bacterium]